MITIVLIYSAVSLLIALAVISKYQRDIRTLTNVVGILNAKLITEKWEKKHVK